MLEGLQNDGSRTFDPIAIAQMMEDVYAEPYQKVCKKDLDEFIAERSTR